MQGEDGRSVTVQPRKEKTQRSLPVGTEVKKMEPGSSQQYPVKGRGQQIYSEIEEISLKHKKKLSDCKSGQTLVQSDFPEGLWSLHP